MRASDWTGTVERFLRFVEILNSLSGGYQWEVVIAMDPDDARITSELPPCCTCVGPYIPVLDKEYFIAPGNVPGEFVIHNRFYKKPWQPLSIISTNSAHERRQVFTTCSSEILRRMLNCTRIHDSIPFVTSYLGAMRAAGWSQRFCRQCRANACSRYDRIAAQVNAGLRPWYRSREFRAQNNTQKNRYAKPGAPTWRGISDASGVISTVARRMIAQEGLTEVLQYSGDPGKNIIQLTCGRIAREPCAVNNCLVCQGADLPYMGPRQYKPIRNCNVEDLVYLAYCTHPQCHCWYLGETGRCVSLRSKEHGRVGSAIWQHMNENPGHFFTFREVEKRGLEVGRLLSEKIHYRSGGLNTARSLNRDTRFGRAPLWP